MALFPPGILKDIPFSKLYPLLSLKETEKIPKLFELGIRWIQIREKYLNLNDYMDLLKEMVNLAEKFNGKIIINDDVDLAKKIKAQGVHLGQEDMPVYKAREILGEETIIGLSCGKDEEVKRALKDPFVDYVAIGPVFKTPFKDKKPLGIEILKKYVGKGKKIVAIGGIDKNNIKKVLKTGVDKVAFIRFLNEIIK